MLIIRILNYIRGFVAIEVWGGFCERFLNLCSRRGVPFWDLKSVEKGRIRLKLPARQFKNIRKIARDTGCSVKIKSKSGLWFSLSKHKKRKIFLLGSVVFILALVALSMFVWKVEITGDDGISRKDIMSNLNDCGIYPGVWKASIDPERAENEMLLKMPELSYIIINLKGSKVSVDVKKRVNPPEIIDKDTPCDIISDKTGVIKRILAYTGQPKVAAGETVVQGQLLVSGVLQNLDQTLRFVHSRADVELRTWYEEEGIIPVSREIKEYSGKTKYKRALIMGKLRINLYINSRIAYANYDKIIETHPLTLFGAQLPITVIEGRFSEYNVKRVDMPLENLKDELKGILRTRVLKQIGNGHIVSEETKYEVSQGTVTAKYSCECLENAGVEAPVKIGSEYGPNNTGGQNRPGN